MNIHGWVEYPHIKYKIISYELDRKTENNCNRNKIIAKKILNYEHFV